MKRVGNGADALQRPLEQATQIAHASRPRQRKALEGGVMRAWQDPGLVWRAGCIGTERDKVAPHLRQAFTLVHLLSNDVAKNAAFLLSVKIEGRAQFVEHAPRNKGSGGQ